MRTAILFLFLSSVLPGWASPFVFDAMLKEEHLSASATTVTMDFHFENKSDKIAIIKNADPGCTCITITIQGGKLTYNPGEKGTIRAVYDMSTFTGVVDKSVILYVDDDPKDEPSVVLTTRVHIPTLIDLEPKTVKWLLGEEPTEKKVTITMNHTDPIRVLRVTGTADGIQHQLRTVTEGKTYELILKPKDTARPALGIFRVETDCAIQKYRVQQAFGVIRKDIQR